MGHFSVAHFVFKSHVLILSRESAAYSTTHDVNQAITNQHILTKKNNTLFRRILPQATLMIYTKQTNKQIKKQIAWLLHKAERNRTWKCHIVNVNGAKWLSRSHNVELQKKEQNGDHHHWHVKTLLQLRVWKGRGRRASWETVTVIRACWGITCVGGWLPVYAFDKEKHDWCRNTDFLTVTYTETSRTALASQDNWGLLCNSTNTGIVICWNVEKIVRPLRKVSGYLPIKKDSCQCLIPFQILSGTKKKAIKRARNSIGLDWLAWHL